MQVIEKKKTKKLSWYKVNRFSENILFFKLLTVTAGTGKVKKKKKSIRKNVGIWMELLQSQSRKTFMESLCIKLRNEKGRMKKDMLYITQSPHGFELKIM